MMNPAALYCRSQRREIGNDDSGSEASTCTSPLRGHSLLLTTTKASHQRLSSHDSQSLLYSEDDSSIPIQHTFNNLNGRQHHQDHHDTLDSSLDTDDGGESSYLFCPKAFYSCFHGKPEQRSIAYCNDSDDGEDTKDFDDSTSIDVGSDGEPHYQRMFTDDAELDMASEKTSLTAFDRPAEEFLEDAHALVGFLACHMKQHHATTRKASAKFAPTDSQHNRHQEVEAPLTTDTENMFGVTQTLATSRPAESGSSISNEENRKAVTFSSPGNSQQRSHRVSALPTELAPKTPLVQRKELPTVATALLRRNNSRALDGRERDCTLRQMRLALEHATHEKTTSDPDSALEFRTSRQDMLTTLNIDNNKTRMLLQKMKTALRDIGPVDTARTIPLIPLSKDILIPHYDAYVANAVHAFCRELLPPARVDALWIENVVERIG